MDMKLELTSWRESLTEAMLANGETWVDVESHTFTDEDLDAKFDHGYGGTEGCDFTLWTKARVYFPVCYDGSEWVGSVARNPDGKATPHQGGG